MFLRISILQALLSAVALFSFVSASCAAPFDYNDDSFSDPSTVEVGETLRWVSQIDEEEVEIQSSFGQSGDHLVPGKYVDEDTMPAVLNSDGIWTLSDESTVSFGEEGALYLAGADFNGDSLADYAYSSVACQNKRSTFHIRLNGEVTSNSFGNGRGVYYKFYYDADDDGQDDFCYLMPIRKDRELTPRFRTICKNAITGKRSRRFTVGRVNAQPHPVKVANGPDLLLIPQEISTGTLLKFFTNTGSRHSKKIVEATGTLIIGNFTSTDSEQIAIVEDQVGNVYDPLDETSTTITFPEGVPYDEINIVHFEDTENCFCTSKTIKKYGACSDGSSTPKGSTNITLPDNCSNPPEHLSSNDGFKCMASATRGGSVVCLLPYQFTWAPYKYVTDHHNYTFACNKSDIHFDSVHLVLESDERIALSYAGCQNYVATEDGPIGRQHFRNENYKWNDLKRRVKRMEMTKGDQTTCLGF